MPPIRHIFLDDGDVMNDNAVRGPQWRRLIGEFFVPRLGGTPEAWAAANLAIVDEVDKKYWTAISSGVPDAIAWRDYLIDWVRSMAAGVGVAAPTVDDECLALSRAASSFIRPRIDSAYPGAIEAIRSLATGYSLYTASNEHSEVLHDYLYGMGVLHLFQAKLYGPDLVRAVKPEIAFYERISPMPASTPPNRWW